MPEKLCCPDCLCDLDDHDNVFGVWVCPNCDEVVVFTEDDPLYLLADMPEAP